MSYNVVDQNTGELGQVAGSQINTIYADAPIGAIVPYGGDTAPTGYLLCDGSAVSRSIYSDLYAVIGTKYGEGDGSTTFNLPDGEAGAELYPAADVGSGIAGSVYIIKAIKTALPSDIQAEIDGCSKLAEANNFEGQNVSIGKHRVLKHTNIEVGGTPPASTLGGNSALQIKDNVDNIIGYLNCFFENDGSVDMHLSGNASGNANGKLYLAGKSVLVNNVDISHSNKISVIADGVKTWQALIEGVRDQIDINKLSSFSYLQIDEKVYHIMCKTSVWVRFGTITYYSNLKAAVAFVDMDASVVRLQSGLFTDSTLTDSTSAVPNAGTVITLYV